MKIKVTTTNEKVIDVSLPTYRTNHTHYWKVIAEDKVIGVYNGKDSAALNLYDHLCGAFNEDTEECTAALFLRAFVGTSDRLMGLACVTEFANEEPTSLPPSTE